MKLKNQNIKLRYTQDIETGEYYFFINNVQVDYYVLLKREVNNGTVTFIPVQRFIGTTNALFNKAVDYFSNQTYKLCRLDGTGNNRVMVYNGLLNLSHLCKKNILNILINHMLLLLM